MQGGSTARADVTGALESSPSAALPGPSAPAHPQTPPPEPFLRAGSRPMAHPQGGLQLSEGEPSEDQMARIPPLDGPRLGSWEGSEIGSGDWCPAPVTALLVGSSSSASVARGAPSEAAADGPQPPIPPGAAATSWNCVGASASPCGGAVEPPAAGGAAVQHRGGDSVADSRLGSAFEAWDFIPRATAGAFAPPAPSVPRRDGGWTATEPRHAGASEGPTGGGRVFAGGRVRSAEQRRRGSCGGAAWISFGSSPRGRNV